MRPPSPPAQGQLSPSPRSGCCGACAELHSDNLRNLGRRRSVDRRRHRLPRYRGAHQARTLAHEHPNGQAVEVLAAVRRLIMAPRGGLLPNVTLGGHAFPVTIGLTDQWGEFCNGVAFSVGWKRSSAIRIARSHLAPES